MNTDTHIYDRCAALVAYPEHDYKDKLVLFRNELEKSEESGATDGVSHAPNGVSVSYLDQFIDAVKDKPVQEIEELYTQTFDMNPLCCLEVGWHLYGENYDRGAFLVRMRELMRRCELKESSELPDHLTHVLNVLARMERAEADEFALKHVLPALDKILLGFASQTNPYENILKTIRTILVDRHQHAGDHQHV